MAEIDRRKAALIAEIEVSRGEIRSAARRIETDADLVERARKTISSHLGSWLIGATIGGFMISQALRRGKARPSNGASYSNGTNVLSQPGPKSWLSSGLLISAAKLAFDLAKPTLLDWIASRSFQQSQGGSASFPKSNPQER